jgi:uncharacterized damage-inducible protein DinB
MPYTEARKNMSVESLFLQYSVDKLKQFADRIEICLGKLNEEQIWARGHDSENAIGNLVLHLTGNVRQWIVLTLGNKPFSRDRDAEFAARGAAGKHEMSRNLAGAVEQAALVISGLTSSDLTRVFEVQNYQVSGLEAVYHVIEHFAQHTGQIIFATKMLTGDDLEFYGHLRNPVHDEQVP